VFCTGTSTVLFLHGVYLFNQQIFQVWSLEEPEWTCKIDEGSAGLVDVRWSADGRHILTTADFHVCKKNTKPGLTYII